MAQKLFAREAAHGGFQTSLLSCLSILLAWQKQPLGYFLDSSLQISTKDFSKCPEPPIESLLITFWICGVLIMLARTKWVRTGKVCLYFALLFWSCFLKLWFPCIPKSLCLAVPFFVCLFLSLFYEILAYQGFHNCLG